MLRISSPGREYADLYERDYYAWIQKQVLRCEGTGLRRLTGPTLPRRSTTWQEREALIRKSDSPDQRAPSETHLRIDPDEKPQSSRLGTVDTGSSSSDSQALLRETSLRRNTAQLFPDAYEDWKYGNSNS